VDEDAPRDEIRRAYRKLVFQTHPDRNPGDEAKEAQFKIVTEAFTVLSNQQKRAEYDQRILIRSEGSVVFSSMKWHRSEYFGLGVALTISRHKFWKDKISFKKQKKNSTST
jgi:curved DNA-binding protein CbpA